LKKAFPRPLLWLFILPEALIYALFLTLDLSGRGDSSIYVKYAGILLCLVFALICALRGGRKLILPILALTALADLFLLVLDRYYILGVSLFLCVQALYLIHLRRLGMGLGLPLRLSLAGICLAAVCFSGMFSALNLLVALYFSQLLSSAILAWHKRGRSAFLLALGLSLFVGCDLCVGLFNLHGLISPALYDAAAFGMWLFYLPSQVLIVLSALPEKEKNDENK